MSSLIEYFSSGLRGLKECLQEEEFSLACVVIWNIWNYRNGVIHGSEVGERENIVSRSADFLNSYASARISFPLQAKVSGRVSWQLPTALFIKINFEVAFLHSDSFQVAGVARNSEGLCLGWSVRKLPGAPSPVIAEATATRHAILLAIEKGWTHIHLEGDCLQVIKTFKDRDRHGLRSFDSIISAALGLLSNFSAFHVSSLGVWEMVWPTL